MQIFILLFVIREQPLIKRVAPPHFRKDGIVVGKTFGRLVVSELFDVHGYSPLWLCCCANLMRAFFSSEIPHPHKTPFWVPWAKNLELKMVALFPELVEHSRNGVMNETLPLLNIFCVLAHID